MSGWFKQQRADISAYYNNNEAVLPAFFDIILNLANAVAAVFMFLIASKDSLMGLIWTVGLVATVLVNELHVFLSSPFLQKLIYSVNLVYLAAYTILFIVWTVIDDSYQDGSIAACVVIGWLFFVSCGCFCHKHKESVMAAEREIDDNWATRFVQTLINFTTIYIVICANIKNLDVTCMVLNAVSAFPLIVSAGVSVMYIKYYKSSANHFFSQNRLTLTIFVIVFVLALSAFSIFGMTNCQSISKKSVSIMAAYIAFLLLVCLFAQFYCCTTSGVEWWRTRDERGESPSSAEQGNMKFANTSQKVEVSTSAPSYTEVHTSAISQTSNFSSPSYPVSTIQSISTTSSTGARNPRPPPPRTNSTTSTLEAIENRALPPPRSPGGGDSKRPLPPPRAPGGGDSKRPLPPPRRGDDE